MKVAILRPAEYMEETKKLFSSAGFKVVGVPFLRIEEAELEPDNFQFEYAIITSQTAARILINNSILNRLRKARVISIGPSTAKILEGEGIKSLLPSKFDSKTLYTEFKDELKGKKVAIFRSDKGDPELLKLAEIADVREYVLYTISHEHGDEQRKFLFELVSLSSSGSSGSLDAIVFSSRMMVRSFFELAEKSGILNETKDALDKITVVAIGPPTKDELRKFGIDAVIPEKYTFKGVLDLLKQICSSRSSRLSR
ncbi:MAG: uroporphyrinogen-III synthase [Archaeoglobus sp.]|nr:uroporphyrinogen-III synthase [Archaeoglobus sp.]